MSAEGDVSTPAFLYALMHDPPHTQPEFGAWIACRRRAKGWSQAQLAASVGCRDRSVIGHIERGARGVSWERAWQLIDATVFWPSALRREEST